MPDITVALYSRSPNTLGPIVKVLHESLGLGVTINELIPPELFEGDEFGFMLNVSGLSTDELDKLKRFYELVDESYKPEVDGLVEQYFAIKDKEVVSNEEDGQVAEAIAA